MPFIVIQAHVEVQECSTQTALWINPEMDLISDLWQLQLNRELWDLGKHVVKWSKPGESRPTAKSTTRVDMTESFGATVPMRLPWASSPKPRSLLFCTRIGLSSFSNLLYAHMHTINFHIWYRPEYGGPCIMWPPHTLVLPDSCLWNGHLNWREGFVLAVLKWTALQLYMSWLAHDSHVILCQHTYSISCLHIEHHVEFNQCNRFDERHLCRI